MYTIYSKEGCPHCEKVVKMLDLVGLEYRVYKLGEDFTPDQFLSEFGEGSTFPRVLKGEHLIGGASDTLVNLQEQGYI